MGRFTIHPYAKLRYTLSHPYHRASCTFLPHSFQPPHLCGQLTDYSCEHVPTTYGTYDITNQKKDITTSTRPATCALLASRVPNHRDGSGRNDQGVSIGKFRSSFVAPYYMDVRYIHTHYNRIYHRRRRTGDQRLLQEVFSAAKVPRLMPPGRTSEHKRPPSPRT